MNKSSIIIHVGMHKTGTTYLQTSFFKMLRNVEIINSPKFYQNFAKDIDAEFANTNYLISNEGISGVAWNHDWLLGKQNTYHWIDSFETGVRKLKSIFPDPIIIIFFRKHGDLLLSMYKQYIHEGGTLGLEDFYGNDKLIRDKDLSYSTRIDRLKSTFNSVYFLSYEDFKSMGDKFLIKFFGEIGLQIDETKKIKSRSNVSISGWKIDSLRAINKVYIKFPEKIRKAFFRLRISPRHIFQNYLSFWKSKDSEKYSILKNEINEIFDLDWEYFNKHKWNYK